MKTECRHCGGHIEFESDSAGIDAACPHCGMDTPLIDGLHRRAPRASGHPQATSMRFAWAAYAAIAVVAIAIVWFVVAVYRSEFVHEILRDLPGAESMPGIILGAVVLVASCILTVLWITFPWFVYRYLRRIIGLLESINRKL